MPSYGRDSVFHRKWLLPDMIFKAFLVLNFYCATFMSLNHNLINILILYNHNSFGKLLFLSDSHKSWNPLLLKSGFRKLPTLP